MRILAIDFGTKKIGLSLGNFKEKSIKLLSPVEYNEKILEKLKNLILKEKINLILLGIPFPFNPENSWIYKKILKFALNLRRNLKIPVILFNEEDTSKIASERFKKKHLSIHSLSSKILLERFFNLK